jgi:hypothetical protein
MSSQISRLSVVCKVLFDAEVIALRKEVEELKLSLFWKKYSTEKLWSAIKDGNGSMPDMPRNCNCKNCREFGRFCMDGSFGDDNPNEVCAWRPLFEAKLAELGIGFSNKPDSPQWLIHDSASGENVIDCDTHIVNFLNLNYDPLNHYKGTSHDWSHFTYGSKLFKATTVNDPELQKLAALFEWLLVPPTGYVFTY